VSLEPGEIVIREDEVRQMLEKAFQKVIVCCIL